MWRSKKIRAVQLSNAADIAIIIVNRKKLTLKALTVMKCFQARQESMGGEMNNEFCAWTAGMSICLSAPATSDNFFGMWSTSQEIEHQEVEWRRDSLLWRYWHSSWGAVLGLIEEAGKFSLNFSYFFHILTFSLFWRCGSRAENTRWRWGWSKCTSRA